MGSHRVGHDWGNLAAAAAAAAEYALVLTIIQNKYFQIVFLLWLWVFKTVFEIFECMDFLFVSVIDFYIIIFSWLKKKLSLSQSLEMCWGGWKGMKQIYGLICSLGQGGYYNSNLL